MIDGDELELFAASVRNATDTATGTALDDAIRGLGWHDALGADRRVAVSVLFELQGRAGATSSALDTVFADALGVTLQRAAGIVFPPLRGWEAPGRRSGGAFDVRGLGSAGLAHTDDVVVVVADGPEHRAAVIHATALALRPISGLDPDLGLIEVKGENVGAASEPTQPAAWADAVAAGQLAVAHELIGASRAMLELARDHAVQRIQFDQPIARFQAVRHRLADAYVAIESADAAVGAAWDDGSPLAAAAAKAIAGRSGRLVARHCQQVLAGIGFTTEHPLHRYVRRVLVLDSLFGDARSLTRATGDELLRTRQVPPMLPL